MLAQTIGRLSYRPVLNVWTLTEDRTHSGRADSDLAMTLAD